MQQSVMDRRVLGGEGLVVPALGIGCSGLSEIGAQPRDDVELMAMMHLAFDLGLTFIDSDPDSEAFLARAIKGRRNKVVLATRVGRMELDGGGVHELADHPERVVAAVEHSLQRLGVDHIDLVCLEPLWGDARLSEAMGALSDLVAAGKVRYLGLHRPPPRVLKRANDVHPLSAVQHEYSVWEREVEAALLPEIRELGVGLIALEPLGPQPRVEAGTGAGPGIDDLLRRMARAHDATPAQMALAWLLQRSEDVVPVPLAPRRSSLLEDVQAIDLQLDHGELELLDDAYEAETPPQAPYPGMGPSA